jgi:Tol biopolymer transport system component
LKTIGISGGLPLTLCSVSSPKDNQGKGGTWNRNGDILYATVRGDALYRVSAFGGTPQKVTTLDRSNQEESHRWPYFLPDGRHFIYLVRLLDDKGGRLYAGSLDSSERTLIFEQHESNVVYAPSGHLLFVKDQNLMAQAFDAASLKVTGEPIRVASPVDVLVVNRALFSVSETGSVVFHSAGSADFVSQLVRFDRDGTRAGTIGPDTPYGEMRLSPNGQNLAYSRVGLIDEKATTLAGKLWVLDLGNGVQSSFSSDMNFRSVTAPIWSPDGSEVFFAGAPYLPDRPRSDVSRIYRVPVRGIGKTELVLEADGIALKPLDITRDGTELLVGAQRREGSVSQGDIWAVDLSAQPKVRKFLDTSYGESEGRFSPDGQWVVYTSNESGKDEVYIRAFPSGENKTLISTGGGNLPVWQKDGKEILYVSADGTLTAVDVKSRAAKRLFKLPTPESPQNYRAFRWWDVTPTGESFYAIVVPDRPSIQAVLNWTAQSKP